MSRPTVNRWRARYVEAGLDGLADEDRPGRPQTVDPRRIVAATLTPPPARLGVTHWSSRLLAAKLKVNHVTITKAWKQFGVKPWKAETFKFSTDPELEAKVADVIGLYLRPPVERGRAVCGREVPDPGVEPDPEGAADAARARRATHPRLRPARHDHLVRRAGGRDRTVTGLCKNRHRHQEFLAFLRHVARAYPDQQLHVVMDNYAAHKRPEVKAWLKANPRIHVHFTPTSASWLNLVEVWFGIIERKPAAASSPPSAT